MLRDLESLIKKNDELDAYEMKAAAAYILGRQFIYRSDSSDREHYLTISEHRSYFGRLFDALGYRLVIDDDYSFIGITAEIFFRPMKTTETLFLLIARLFYDDEARDMQSNGDTAMVSYDNFMDRYELLTGRPRLANTSQINEVIANLQRYNVIRRSEVEGRIPVIHILPGIVSLISQPMAKQIGGFSKLSIEEDEVES